MKERVNVLAYLLYAGIGVITFSSRLNTSKYKQNCSMICTIIEARVSTKCVIFIQKVGTIKRIIHLTWKIYGVVVLTFVIGICNFMLNDYDNDILKFAPKCIDLKMTMI
jgi:hypothetical protein